MKVNEDKCTACHNTGYVFDYTLGKPVPCPACAKSRKRAVQKGANEEGIQLARIFGLESSDLSGNFVYDAMLPRGEQTFLTASSIKNQRAVIDSLLTAISDGTKPSKSYCFGISAKGRMDLLIYPILVKAYEKGMSIAPAVTCRRLYELSLEESREYNDYIQADIAVVIIPEYPTYASLGCAKGLMQERAMKNRATIFVTSFSVMGCASLLAEAGSNANKWLAEAVFVEYEQSPRRSRYEENMIPTLTADFTGEDAQAKKIRKR